MNKGILSLGSFPETQAFVYEQTSTRLRLRKAKLGLTNYQIAGFDDHKHYESADGSEKKVDVNILSKIMNYPRSLGSRKKAKYLIPSTTSEFYYDAFIQQLHFSSIYEILWGDSREYKKNLPKIFGTLYTDSLNCCDADVRNVFSELLDLDPGLEYQDKIDSIYSKVYSSFNDEWFWFTTATKQNNDIATIVGEDTNTQLFDVRDVKELYGTVQSEYLGFKKLDSALEKFVLTRITPLLMRVSVEYLAQ